jgi:hypothetical protein
MSRETHVRFYESLGVKLPGATHPGPEARVETFDPYVLV